MKLNLMVCPHDSARFPDRWFRFSQYLTAQGTIPVHFDFSLDFKEFHKEFRKAGIVFANPGDSLRLIEQEEYISLARPSNLFDEVVFIAAPAMSSPELSSLRGERVATVLGMFPTNLGVSVLQGADVWPVELESQESWMAVVRGVARGKYKFGFLYEDFYDDLADLAKNSVTPFYRSDEKVAFHMLLLNRAFADYAEELREKLSAMHAQPRGKAVLDALGIEEWLPVADSHIEEMVEIQRIVA